MNIIANIAVVMIINSILCTAYPQQLCISSGIQSKTQLRIVEKPINKESDYLKEDIKIPQLTGGMDKNKVDLINSKINDDILPKVEEAEKTATEYFGGAVQERPRFPYEIFSKYKVTEDNNSIISLFNDYYEFLGGAHGMTTKTSYTIDKKQEKLLTLKDLFVQGYNYTDVINKEIKAEISKHPENYFDSGDVFKGINENQSFYIENNNLVIYYQLYDLAPYVFGFPEFKVPVKLFDKNFVYSVG